MPRILVNIRSNKNLCGSCQLKRIIGYNESAFCTAFKKHLTINGNNTHSFIRTKECINSEKRARKINE